MYRDIPSLSQVQWLSKLGHIKKYTASFTAYAPLYPKFKKC